MYPSHSSEFHSDHNSQLEDYLNDKLQTTADLGTLSNLVAGVEIQKLQLEAQLQDARKRLEEAKQRASDDSSFTHVQTREFKKQHNEVQRKLMVISASDSPGEAVARLRVPMEKLRKVELGTKYVELLSEIDEMVQEAHKNLPANPKEALKPYARLKHLAISMRNLQEPAEGAGVHIVEYVDSVANQLWSEMRQIMSNDFEIVLNKLQWPRIAIEPTPQWKDSFDKLLDLQAPELFAAKDPVVLLPMNVLAKDFVLQFKYHFMSSKPTGSSEHLGDYIFEWVSSTTSKWEPYLRDNIGPVLFAHFQGTSLASKSVYVDPVAAFIMTLLPILSQKVTNIIDDIHNQPQKLSKIIAQILDFDDRLRQDFLFDAGDPELGWKGVAWDVLNMWFDEWLQVEKAFAFDRYHEIVEKSENATVDYDSSEVEKPRPTYASVMVTDLLKSISRQYAKLRRFSHKLRFLLHLQMKLLDRYHMRLVDAIEKYHALTSIVGRTVHGFTKEEQVAVEGIGGLEALCKIFGSTDLVIRTLQDMSNEEFFVDLWEELQRRALKKTSSDFITEQLSYEEIKDATSRTMGTEHDGSVFDESIASYTQTRFKVENYLVQAIKYSFPVEFRAYVHRSHWTSLGEESSYDESQATITPFLDAPLRHYQSILSYLYSTLSYPTFLRILRLSIPTLQDLLWTDLLLKQDFTALGAWRFENDVSGMQSVINSFLRPDSVKVEMAKLKEGVRLLNLPTEEKEGEEANVTLKEADELIYAGVGPAADLLAKLGFVHLVPGDARAILGRRVECAG